ncbi:DUF1801 domain-containing protein [candidate division KSB1 bacterium]|nr:DUF1801 domain-containing protein [candidate division KSB1 bacterium]
MQKDRVHAKDIDEYINSFPADVREILARLRQTIRQAAPEADETISYQMPTYKLNGNLVHFAAYANHIGFYPTPSAIEEFKEDLSRYEGAKGSIRFPIDEPLPLDLISRIVKFRVAENLAMKKKERRQL